MYGELLTPAELAAALKIHKTTLWRWEQRGLKPDSWQVA